MLALPEIVTGNEENQEGGKDKEQAAGSTSKAGCRGQARNCSDRQYGHCHRKYGCGDIESKTGLTGQPYWHGADPPDVRGIHIHNVFAELPAIKQAPGERHEISFVVVDWRKK